MSAALRVRALRLGVVAALLLGPGLVVTGAPAAAAYAPSAATVAAYEARVIYSMNVQRARYGISKLAPASCPDAWADWWAAYLARTGYFYHRPMTALLSGCHATRAAENMARGWVTADAVVAMWMASSPHRAEILDSRLTQVGVGAVYASGQWTVVADLTRP